MYRVAGQELACGDRKARLALNDGHLRLQLFVDRTSVDIFGNDGRLYMPMGVIVPPENRGLAMDVREGEAK